MERETRRISWEEGVYKAASRVAIEGVLRLPGGMEDMAAIADVAGEAEIGEVKVADGRLSISGKVRFTVLYANTLGMLDSFESESSFAHTEENAGFASDMQAMVKADIVKISVRIQDGRSAALRADIVLSVSAVRNISANVLAARWKDVELLTKSIALPVTRTVRTSRIVMERSVRIPQTMPRMERVLLARGRAHLDRAERDEGDLAIEGGVHAGVVYLSEDKNAPLQYLVKNLPFGDIVEGAGADEVCADVRVEKINVYRDPDDEDALLMRITLAVYVTGRDIVDTDVICDMYSRKCGLELEKQEICFVSRRETERELRHLRLTVDIPEGSPEPARVLYASGRTERTVCEDGMVKCEAILNLVAATEAGTRGINVPVTFEMPCSGENVKVYIDDVAVSGAGKTLEATVSAEICAEKAETLSVQAVTAVCEKETEKEASGVVVYFADGRESLWDIAKKFRVRKDSLSEKMAFEDVVPKGTRLIMLK